jgi:hypothetical protein
MTAKKRPARIGNPDLCQQKHVPTPPIEEIEKKYFHCYLLLILNL